MGSTRLPGKVLMTLGGRSVLANVLARMLRAECVSRVVCATSALPGDDAVAEEALRAGARVYRGSAGDVLDRFAGAAAASGADVIVRITADCPLVDPQTVDRMVYRFGQAHPPIDYLSNCIQRTFPRGLDVEVFSRAALEQSAEEAVAAHQREHVTPYIYEQPNRFVLENYVRDGEDLSGIRLTLDEAADFVMLTEVFRGFGGADPVSATFSEVLECIRERELQTLNAGVRQKTLND